MQAVIHALGAPSIIDNSILLSTDQASGVATANYELMLPPANKLIEGSARAFVRVVGDVMGPALSNIESLLRMPYGCAEQTMVSFAPNIFVMKYLEAINKDKPDLRKKAIQYMKSGKLYIIIASTIFIFLLEINSAYYMSTDQSYNHATPLINPIPFLFSVEFLDSATINK